MFTFWYEYAFFLSSSLAILVSIASAVLFIIAFRDEKKLATIWRPLAFFLLAIAYLGFILERKDPRIETIATLVNLFAIFSLFRGILAEPDLSALRVIAQTSEKTPSKAVAAKKRKEAQSRIAKTFRLFGTFFFAVLLVMLPLQLLISTALPSLIQAVTIGFLTGIVILQYRRYKNATKKSRNKEAKKTIYPVIAFLFLLIREIAVILHRLPESNIVFIRKLTLEYSLPWEIAVVSTFLAFLFLAIWSWDFIKIRSFLRTYVVLISTVIFVATLGFLIFTFLIFQIIEKNNFDLMLQGAETESIIMDDRANTALFISRIIASDDNLITNIKSGNYNGLIEQSEDFLANTDVDILRIYNVFGEVIASPTDIRDRGEVFADDSLLTFSLIERRLIKSFGTYPGILTDFLITRGIHPIISNNAVIGAVEVGYKFDNAFVDFSKDTTNLDVTIYTDNKISATTIKALDGVSRFIGSEETDPTIIENVLSNGQRYSSTVERFDEVYYSAFTPVRDINGVVIGMISVGTPTFSLIEDTRQQLITTFIFVTVISMFIALLSYYAIPNLRTNGPKE